jgi:arylsulfatase
MASSSPFRFFKGFTAEGGIKAPLMVKMPGSSSASGKWNRTFLHVTDIMPTILELTGSTYPANYKGNDIHPLIGKSILPIFQNDSVVIHKDDGMGYELFEMKAYIKGRWKLLRLPKPLGSGNWELYDIEADPGETTDLSAKHPDIVAELTKAWNEYARNNQVHDHKGHYDSFYRRTF